MSQERQPEPSVTSVGARFLLPFGLVATVSSSGQE